MKKIKLLRCALALLTVFGVGAVATLYNPIWVKIILGIGVGGYLLLREEFEHEQKSSPRQQADGEPEKY